MGVILEREGAHRTLNVSQRSVNRGKASQLERWSHQVARSEEAPNVEGVVIRDARTPNGEG